MKKTVSVALSALMACAIAGCSSAPAADSKVSSATDSSAASSTTADAKEILIGISPDYPPYESKDSDGKIVGFDPEMTEWIFNYLNENGHNYTYKFEELSFDTIISALQAGQIDLGISGFTYDEDREGIFSDSYYDSAQVIVVPADSTFTSAEDLNGKTVGAQQGATGEEAAAMIEGAQVQAVQDANLMMESLKAQGIDAVVIDKAVADQYVANGEFKIIGENLMDEENIIYSTEANQELMDEINEAIKAFKESDEYKAMTDKWFGSDAE